MRKISWVVVLAVLAWSGWWFAASTGLRGGIAGWFEARAAEGWQAEVAQIDSGGFPLSLEAGLRDVALADPDAGLAIETDRLDIRARAAWPGDVTVILDDGPILLASPLGRSTLTMQTGVMALNLHAGTALELEKLSWTAGPWKVANAIGTQAEAQTLDLTMNQRTGATYDLAARAAGFAPGDVTRQRLLLPDNFPRAFDSLQMQAEVTFDTMWDRRALDTQRPQPRQIRLHRAEARWGDLSLNFAANLTVDADGMPDGTLSVQAQNWRTILDLVERSQVLPSSLRGQAETVLQALAGASGNPSTLDVDLTISGGWISLGFLPLIQAPRLMIR